MTNNERMHFRVGVAVGLTVGVVVTAADGPNPHSVALGVTALVFLAGALWSSFRCVS